MLPNSNYKVTLPIGNIQTIP